MANSVARECVLAPARAVALRLARGQIGYLNLRYPLFQLLLMPRIQSGDGAARTDAEDEEHEPFSHDLPSSRLAFQSASKCSSTHLRQVATCSAYARRASANASATFTCGAA